MPERFEELIDKKYLEPYGDLISELNQTRQEESNEDVHKAFQKFTELKAGKITDYNKDFILSVLHAADEAGIAMIFTGTRHLRY